MNNDDELWTRYISKEEDEQMIRNGIIAEEKEISFNEGHTKGKEEGIKEGLIQKEKEMIISLHNNGVSLDVISKASNISLNEVKEIIEENEKIN